MIKHNNWCYYNDGVNNLRGKFVNFGFSYSEFKVQKKCLIFNIIPFYITLYFSDDIIRRNCFYEQYIAIGYFKKSLDFKHSKFINTADIEEKKIRNAAIMLNWILTHYQTTNDGHTFGWDDSMGNKVSSADIAIKYFKQQ
jgi:hypothetical protein